MILKSFFPARNFHLLMKYPGFKEAQDYLRCL